MVPGIRLDAVCENACAALPLPIEVPPLLGTRVPNASLHEPGFDASMRNQPVVAAPLGLMVPLSDAEVPPMPLAALVTTVGSVTSAVNDSRLPRPVPAELVAIAQ